MPSPPASPPVPSSSKAEARSEAYMKLQGKKSERNVPDINTAKAQYRDRPISSASGPADNASVASANSQGSRTHGGRRLRKEPRELNIVQQDARATVERHDRSVPSVRFPQKAVPMPALGTVGPGPPDPNVTSNHLTSSHADPISHPPPPPIINPNLFLPVDRQGRRRTLRTDPFVPTAWRPPFLSPAHQDSFTQRQIGFPQAYPALPTIQFMPTPTHPHSQPPVSAGAGAQQNVMEQRYYNKPGESAERPADPFSIVNLSGRCITFTYMLLLLSLPSVYWRRARRIYEIPGVREEDFIALVRGLGFYDETIPEKMSKSWEIFVQGHLEEWKALNMVSVLLCGVLITMLQIDDAAQDPLVRWTILYSVVFALLSLVYGCILVIHFSGLRNTMSFKGWLHWIIETQNGGTNPLWNPYIILAIPAIWLTWSLIMFCVIIIAFAWRSDSSGDPIPRALSHRSTVGARVALTVLFGISFYYLVAILVALSTRIPDEGKGTFDEPKTPTTANSPLLPRENGSRYLNTDSHN